MFSPAFVTCFSNVARYEIIIHGFADKRSRCDDGFRRSVYEASDGILAVVQHEAAELHSGRDAFAPERGS